MNVALKCKDFDCKDFDVRALIVEILRSIGKYLAAKIL